VLADPAMQARSGRETPVWLPAPPRMFPVPSYASRRFREAAGEWLRAVGEVVAPRRAPEGPVVLAQADNEMQMFFRVGAYDSDYHPDALAWWREFSGGLEAPRRWDPAREAACLKWVAFKDEYAARALHWVAEAMRQGGFEGLPLFHNSPPSEPEYLDLPAAERAVGAVGMDFYHRRGDLDRYRRRALYLAGTAETLPFAPEVGLGGPLWLPPMSPDDQEQVIRGLLMFGLRGLMFFMVVDRERWYGAPITREGQERPPAPFVRRLLQILDEVGWTRLRRKADVALVVQSGYARLSTASSLADPVTPILYDYRAFLGPAGAAELSRDGRAREHRLRVRETMARLQRSGVPHVFVDEKLPAARLAGYRRVLVPVLDRIDRRLLHAIAELAGRVDARLGPGRPTHDEWGQPLGEDLVHVPEISDLDPGPPPSIWIARSDRVVETALYEDERGTPRVLFVATSDRRGARAELAVPSGTILEDCFSGRRIDPGELALGAGEVLMLRALT
jgi:beta-galactosidase